MSFLKHRSLHFPLLNCWFYTSPFSKANPIWFRYHLFGCQFEGSCLAWRLGIVAPRKMERGILRSSGSLRLGTDISKSSKPSSASNSTHGRKNPSTVANVLCRQQVSHFQAGGHSDNPQTCPGKWQKDGLKITRKPDATTQNLLTTQNLFARAGGFRRVARWG